ncbi:Uma2 family endonuclease [Anthocerotibacter panamensis]|uniref:Uma2 family endonuclease n=1 Tax=Anthocerotibacter panamensis TaxID=2857077 RepID=UPI001C402BBE|nr:Uma2 family endonuclease [Anthocerotibacter panamensis]
MTTLTLSLDSVLELTDVQFSKLCQRNPDLRLERTAQGELVAMAPTGGESSRRNADLCFELVAWNRKQNLGVVFDSSGGFMLPNGAIRSPDVAWVRLERWDALSPQQREKFLPLSPDFVLELRSVTDNLAAIQAKMREYMANGVRLGWLLDPQTQGVEVYTDGAVTALQAPEILSGGEVLPGFVLKLREFYR